LEVKEGGVSKCPLLPGLPAALELKLRTAVVEGEHACCVFEVTDAHVFDKDASALDHKTAGLHYAG
jgi:flavin reductase (DIM6/NTAB) family NADH-FMN oxidoreductase RutF